MHLSWKHSFLIDHSHLHLPAFCLAEGTKTSQVFQFIIFLQPAHWFFSSQVFSSISRLSIISGACWNCWDVDVTVNEGEGAIPLEEFDMQGHPDLGDGEGGAGVLLAVAGSLMRE